LAGQKAMAPEITGEDFDCPSSADLRAFLAGTSREIDRHGVATHVETCAECRSQLDRWTNDDLEGPTTPGGEIMTVDHPPASDGRESLGRLGPYQLLERIGQGGMGVVIKALDERLNRVVAVKMLARVLADGAIARQRFLREARAAAAVCHDHIVTIHAVAEIAGQPFIVMQLVAGESLQQKLDRDGPLPVTEVARIGMQTASGLAAAHARGLVHRDIKPANILIETGTEREDLEPDDYKTIGKIIARIRTLLDEGRTL
jgi:serine/threonine protein kinase